MGAVTSESLTVTVDEKARSLLEKHDAADSEGLANFALEQVHLSTGFITKIDDLTATYENQQQRDAMRDAVRELAAQNLGEALIGTQLLGIQFKVRGETDKTPPGEQEWMELSEKIDNAVVQTRDQFFAINDRQPRSDELVHAMAPSVVDVCLRELAAKPDNRSVIARTLGSTLLYHIAPNK